MARSLDDKGNSAGNREFLMFLFLLQCLNFIAAVAISLVVRYVWHGSIWMAVFSGIAYFIVAWFVYLVVQSLLPDWWAPWGEGLPREQRMMDAFIPALMAYLMFMLVVPVFELAREKAEEARRSRQKPGIARPVRAPGTP